MPPSTAIQIVVLSAALALRLLKRERRFVFYFAWIAVGLAFFISAAVMFEHLLGKVPLGENLLIGSDRFLGRLPVGHMSPVAAAIVMILAAAMAATQPPLARNQRWPIIGLVAMCCGVALTGLTLLAWLARAPLFRGSGSLPVSPLSAAALLLLFIALLLDADAGTYLNRLLSVHPELADDSASARRRGFSLLAAFVAILLMAGGSSHYYLSVQQQKQVSSVGRELESILDLKIDQIRSWLDERLGNARVLKENPFLPEQVAAIAAGRGSAGASPGLVNWMRTIRQTHHYAQIVLFDAALRPLHAEPEGAGLASADLQTGLQPWGLGTDIKLMPPYVDTMGKLHLDLLVPLWGEKAMAPVGAILLRIDPEEFLLPTVRSWPTERKSAESVLWWHDGDRLLNLSGYRGGAGMAAGRPLGDVRMLKDSMPLTAARVVRGEHNLVEAVDYRGVPDIGLGRPIPGTDWLLVCKVDRDEVYAPLRATAWKIGGAIVGLLSAAGLAARMAWKRRRDALRQRQLLAELERKQAVEQLGLVMRHANDIIFVMDEAGRILEASNRALIAYGYTLDELRQLPPGGLRPSNVIDELPHDLDGLRTDEGVRFETVHRRKDGSLFPISVSGRLVDIEGNRRILGIYRDITERKAYERQIERLNRLYRVLSEINQTIIRAPSAQELFAAICRILVEIGQFKIAWVGWNDPVTHAIKPITKSGDETCYVDTLEVFSDDSPAGRGPSGTAFRENRTYICNDFFADPGTFPWRNQAQAAGLRASIALPIRQAGAAVGLLAVYAAEKDFFKAREISLLEEAASDLSFALEVLAGEEQRRAAEVTRAASERRLQCVLGATPAVIYSCSVTDGHVITFVSENVLELTGYSAADFIAQPTFWLDHVHAADRDAARLAPEPLMTDDRITREYRLQHKNGDYGWILDELRLMRDDDNKPLEFVGSWLDITVRKQTEMRLKEQLDELRRWHEVTLNRENRVLELKREVNELSRELGRVPPYPSAIAASQAATDQASA